MGWKDLLGLTPTPHDLARTLIQRAAPPGHGRWHYDAAQNQIRGDHGITINLANIHNEYARAQRGVRPALLRKYLALMLPEEPRIPKLWSSAKPHLYIVVRSRYDYALAAIADAPGDLTASNSLQLPWVGDLCLKLVYDLGPSVILVARSYLEDWGQSEAQVCEQGLRNLAGLVTPRWVALADGVYRLESAVSYEESLLLVERVAAGLPLPGTTAVFLPVNRGLLLACDGSSPAALDAMLEAARYSLIEQPWPMAATLLHQVDGTWQEFTASAPSGRKVEALKKINSVQIYNSQRNALQQYCEQQQDEVFVASFQLRQASDDPDDLQSFSTWTEGTATLLPRTDNVAFVRAAAADQQCAMVPWAQVLEVCGHRMRATDWEPARFRVDEFPSAVEWQRLLLLGRDT